MSDLFAAPLTRGEASSFCERGVFGFAKNQTPRSPSAHDPLVRGSATVREIV